MYTVKFDATAMFSQFRTLCTCKGKKPQYILFTRIGRGTKRFIVNNVFWGLMKEDSDYVVGDIINNAKGETLFLVAKVDSYRSDKAEFYKTNCTISVTRLVDKFDGYNLVGKEQTIIQSDIKCVYEDITAKMHLYDIGLLNTTTKRFIIPQSVDIQLLDRIILLGGNYQVDNINKSDFPGFLYVQCSIDERG